MSSEDQRDFTWLDHVGAVNLFARFFAEMALMVAMGFSGWRVPEPTATKVLLMILAAMGFALVWAFFFSPKAKWRVPDPSRLVLELAIFVGVGVLLASVELTMFGVIVAGAATLTSLLMLAFGQRGK